MCVCVCLKFFEEKAVTKVKRVMGGAAQLFEEKTARR